MILSRYGMEIRTFREESVSSRGAVYHKLVTSLPKR